MAKILGPKGWTADQVVTRFSNTAPSPSSYNKMDHTVDCVISVGSPVVRFYGTEKLRISPEAVDLGRMKNGSMIPLLDSHQSAGIINALGRFQSIWIDNGKLKGKILFNQTPNGQLAEGMVERGEIAGISAGYQVQKWEITDGDGTVIDPESQQVGWEDSLTFTAVRWSLHEGSLVSVPADALSGIRSIGGGDDIADVRARMQARQAIIDIRAEMEAPQGIINRNIVDDARLHAAGQRMIGWNSEK
jgi:phage head maturation protease